MRVKKYLVMAVLITLIFMGCALVNTGAGNAPYTDIEKATHNAVDRAFKDVKITGTKVAVIHIQTPNKNLNVYLHNEIQHILETRGYSLVDKALLDRVRAEQGILFNSVVDDNTAVELGKGIEADVVLNGRIVKINEANHLRLKVNETRQSILKGVAGLPVKNIKLPSNLSFNVFGGAGYELIQTECKEIEKGGDFVITPFGGISFDIRLGTSYLIIEPGVRGMQRQLSFTVDEKYNIDDWVEYHTIANVFTKLKYDFRIGRNFSILPVVGLEAGVLLDAKVKDGDKIEKDLYTSPMYVVPVGLDFVLFRHLVIGAEYDIGIKNIWKDDYTDVRTNTIMGKIGLKF